MSRPSLRQMARRIRCDGVTLWFACRDARTPVWIRLLAWGVVAYACSPIDLVPDFIPVLGYLDDVLLLPGLIWLAVRALPEQVRDDCRARAQAWLARQSAPVSRWGLALVLALWALLAWWLWRWLSPVFS